jgi:phage gpG-like protein
MKNQFLRNFLSDLKVELLDEFDKNFERKGFFDKPWEHAKSPNRIGSLMARSGALRNSIRAIANDNSIRFMSSLPYAAIHNEGGVITVTEKMKKYFWAMYYKNTNAIRYSVKTKSAVYDARTQKLSKEASFWKAMALKKVGSKIKIEQRQFIGPHREVDLCVERVFDRNMKEFEDFITKTLKK